MTLIRKLNAALARMTGYEITRAGTAATVQELQLVQRKERQRAAREAERSSKRIAQRKAKRAAARRAKRVAARQSQQTAERKAAQAAQRQQQRATDATFPDDFDEEAREVIRAVKPWTMTSKEKLYGLVLATRYITRHQVPGDIVECGVWRGGSMQAAARTLLTLGDTQRHLHLFDTFEGMPPPGDMDMRKDGRLAEELLAENDKQHKVWAVATLDDVQAGMAQIEYPQTQVHYHQGMVEETIPDKAPEQIAILRLDTDWYESTRHELTHLYSRLSSGGVLILDDYGHWEGARRAVDEFLEETGARLLLLRASSGRIAVKP